MTTATIQPSQIPGGQYNATPPTLTDQQTYALQIDASGYLKVSLVGSGTGSGGDVNLADVAGAAVQTGHGTAAGSIRVELPTDGTGVVGINGGSVGLLAGTATIGGVRLVASATGGYTAANITTSTTTTVKSGAGTLHGINVNTLGTVASTVTVYDNTAASGTKLATLDTLTAGNVGWNQYDVAFATGLTIVTTGTSAPDITVSYF